MTALTDAWQAAFRYALLGPRLSATDQALARACQALHEDERDRTAEAIAATHLVPHAPAGDYPALYPAAKKPRSLAAQLEDDCAAAWRYLYAEAAAVAGQASLRKVAQAALTARAVRATQWRMRTNPATAARAFPGI